MHNNGNDKGGSEYDGAKQILLSLADCRNPAGIPCMKQGVAFKA